MSVINTNYLSLVAQNNLQKSQSALGTAIERLSSGLRINSAKDDAAGQAIANRMNAQVQGLNQAARNANDGISAAQTTEGALNQINDNLNRIRVLTVQAENGTNNQDDLDSIQNEITQRLSEINRISEETEFNGTQVLAKGENLSIQVGANDNQRITINMQKINVSTLTLEGFNVNGKGATANTAATKDSLTLAGATRVGTSNEYVKAEPNAAVTSASLFANLKDGDKISADITPNTPATLESAIALADATKTIAAGGVTYTSVGDGTFTYGVTIAQADVATEIEAALKPASGTLEATVKLVDTNGTQTVDILVGSDGKVTDRDGQALYWEPTTGNLSATDSGGLNQATAANIAGAMNDAGGDNVGSTLTIGDATYTSIAAGAVSATGLVATAAEVASAVDTANATGTFTIGSSAVYFDGGAATPTVTMGAVPAGAAAYITADNKVTADAEPSVTGFGSEYTFDAAKNAFTYSTTATYGTKAATAEVKDALEAALTPELGQTTTATVTLGGKSTEVVIASNGNVTSKGSGQQLYIDLSGNLTETDSGGTNNAATAEKLAELVSGPAANATASIAISGGATYTYVDDGTNTTETVTGLTRTATEVQDLLSQNKGASFKFVANDSDGAGTDLTVNFNIDPTGKVADAKFADGASAGQAAYVGTDGKLTAKATEDTSYWVQENGNVTNDSGQRIYQDAEGNFTTKETTATPGGRTTDALAVLDAAIAQVDGFRSDLGAIQNRFESAIENLTTTATNLAAAQSRVQDADYAVEVANMTRAQILQQAGTSVLAQANQIPQGVLSLLR